MTPPTDEFENLRLLLEAAPAYVTGLGSDASIDFYNAARAALPGLLTKHKLVSEAYADYRTTTDEVIATLQRHTKDAVRENAILLARLVKVSAAARTVYLQYQGSEPFDDPALRNLGDVLNEIPPR